MIRSEGKRLVLTFHTTADAIATEKLCKEKQVPGRLIPVPRALTSDCGMAWSMPPEDRKRIEAVLESSSIEVAAWNELFL